MQPDTENLIPEAFLQRMKESLDEEYPAFYESLSGREQKALRINTLSGFTGFGKDLSDSWHLEKVSWEKDGYYYDAEEALIPPGKHPLFEAGAYYIQEASAMYPVNLLDPQRNERVLDLCASPGGKSTQIAARMENTGLLVSNEIIHSRAQVLSANIERMGAANTLVTNMDPREVALVFPAFFDKILVDAPCSGEGMMRRTDEAVKNWSVENVLMCAKRQRDILEKAAVCLKMGGSLVYSTCTFSKEEDEDNIRAFLKDHEDFTLVKSEKLYPHRVRGEGHYAAILKRNGDLAPIAPTSQKGRKEGGDPDIHTALAFLEGFLSEEIFSRIKNGKIVRFGESLYRLPDGIKDIKGIKTLRPGLCLGSVKKGRFIPAHSLGAALKKDDVSLFYDTGDDLQKQRSFLAGMSLVLDEDSAHKMPDGWCVVFFEGAAAGLGKKTGNTIKNHYPKGLRIGI